MIFSIYKKAAAVLLKKPILLWGLSLLGSLLSGLAALLCGVVPVVALVVSLLLSTSMTMVYLHGYRGEEVKSEQLFECFKDWNTIKRVACGMAWMVMWLFIWALIPFAGIVFAIIKGYSWRLTPYILVYEPEVPILDAIKVSAKRTQGFKGQMLGADLLVYGIIFAVSLVLGLLSAIPFIGGIFGLANFLITVIVALFINLFLGLVQAAFYEEITAKLATPAQTVE